ncbi:hypothetical protein DFA_02920 [Cavenderia fasciculata]|uniref:Uncharacterized protein n=1 Tax=Cavenderia fasciculata TaxID=261658 RepID=F4PIU7_CACFS|nr:uncharacterized protein DFA_02920 [Cavenderia fasciculata]EGG24676.1 hypothetical protein DFA_02920 [Cavenderia fasciculata]|eukprot:XP_004362527.1 hypothetical protein DFA_02920 [Cavenderia fasciculata]
MNKINIFKEKLNNENKNTNINNNNNNQDPTTSSKRPSLLIYPTIKKIQPKQAPLLPILQNNDNKENKRNQPLSQPSTTSTSTLPSSQHQLTSSSSSQQNVYGLFSKGRRSKSIGTFKPNYQTNSNINNNNSVKLFNEAAFFSDDDDIDGSGGGDLEMNDVVVQKQQQQQHHQNKTSTSNTNVAYIPQQQQQPSNTKPKPVSLRLNQKVNTSTNINTSSNKPSQQFHQQLQQQIQPPPSSFTSPQRNKNNTPYHILQLEQLKLKSANEPNNMKKDLETFFTMEKKQPSDTKILKFIETEKDIIKSLDDYQSVMESQFEILKETCNYSDQLVKIVTGWLHDQCQ